MSVHPIVDSQWNRLNLLASRGNLSTVNWLKMMLNIGLDALNMDMGIISHIVGEDYNVQFCTHPRYTGKQFFLTETYCDLTLQHNDLVHFKHISQTFHGQPIDEAMQAESYIGMPLYVQGQVYGTVCFVRAEPRRRDFSHDDVKFMAMLTQAVANAFQEAAV
jgi:transcriptional regulator with GAF, ATPase, and Fis domain